MTEPPALLRVLTYNVRSLRDDAAAVARVIRQAAAHVACIQEAPRLVRWRTHCAALARRSGMFVVTGGGTAAGNLILCSLAVDVIASTDQLFSRDRGLPVRGAAVAALRWRGHEFTLAATHLDLVPGPRRRHVAELEAAIEDFRSAGTATIVAGDINDEPGSPPWRALSGQRSDAFAAAGSGDGYTFSARNPQRRIDGIFVAAPITVRTATVLDGPDVHAGSDHRPVLAELEFSDSGRADGG